MSLSLDPDDLLTEIRAAEELRKRVLTNTTALVRRYVGNWYRTDQRGKPRPENMIFNFLATVLPQICFDNPAATVSAKRSITHKPIARYMEMWLNGWIKEVELRTELEQLAVDTLLSFGCAKVGLEPRGDYGGTKFGVQGRFSMEALSPFMVRLPPANTIIDSQADSWESARLLGHMFQRDLTDLENDDRYDAAIVGKLTAADARPLGVSSTERPFKQTGPNQPTRGRVTLYELYFPETRQIGTLTLDAGGGALWARPPADFHGPRMGPYVFFGVYMVPDQVYPLSPIAALAEQDQELNAHAAAAAKEAATAKNLVLVSADQPELGNQIENAPMNSVVRVKGLNASNVLPVSLGGTTEQRLGYLNLLLQRTDRNSGQSEAARGKAQGVTATEASLANAAGDVRIEFLHLKYRDAVKHCLSNVGWYGFHDPAVVAPVSFSDPMSGQQSEGLFLGGLQPGQEDLDWTQFFLDIEPMSMRRVDPREQQQVAQMTLALATQLAPLIVQFPYMNWAEILDLVGEAYNITDLARIMFNQQGLSMIQQGVMAGQMPGLNPQLPGMVPPSASQGVKLAAGGAPVAATPPMRPTQLPSMPSPQGGAGAMAPAVVQALAKLAAGVSAQRDGRALGYLPQAA